jgi:hypothetical protein
MLTLNVVSERRKLWWFLLCCFVISWGSAALQYLCGVKYGSTLSLILTASVFMLAPAIAALVVQKLIYKEDLRLLGFSFKGRQWKKLFWMPLINILFCSSTIAVVWIFGNIAGIKGFGFFSVDQELFVSKMAEIIKSAGIREVPAPPVSAAILLPVMIIAGSLLGLVNVPATLGEEIGWRGFLYQHFATLSRIQRDLTIGIIWGIWHAPLILQGHNYPQHPLWGVLFMVIFCVSLSFLLSEVREMCGNVLAPAALHAMINATAAGVMLYIYDYSDVIGGIAGIAGSAGAMITFFILRLLRRKNSVPVQSHDLVAAGTSVGSGEEH